LACGAAPWTEGRWAGAWAQRGRWAFGGGKHSEGRYRISRLKSDQVANRRELLSSEQDGEWALVNVMGRHPPVTIALGVPTKWPEGI